MIILVDGYNLLKHLFPREKGKLDKQRDQLVRHLGFYKKRKSGGIKEIIIVFDGGRESRATREVRQGIVVIFSGQKASADDWIAKYVERTPTEDLLLVTRDRGLIARCRSPRLESISVVTFYDIVKETIFEELEEELSKEHESIKKYKHDNNHSNNHEIQSEALDLLMSQTPLEEYKKEDILEDKNKRKGTPRKLSKKEKKLRDRLEKL